MASRLLCFLMVLLVYVWCGIFGLMGARKLENHNCKAAADILVAFGKLINFRFMYDLQGFQKFRCLV